MKQLKFPESFIKKCKQITAKRPRTVIDHILKHGFITTQELKDEYGYNHPPRAARDVRELGIPVETYRVTGSDGRKIAAYRFGDLRKARFSRLHGRTAFSKELKRKLIKECGSICTIYLEKFTESELQIDHRVPYEVLGDEIEKDEDPKHFMLLSGSANRAKSWSCEHCPNWLKLKNPAICRKCYWAFPDNYEHVAMRQVRRLDLLWTEEEITIYNELKERAESLQKNMPVFVKEILERFVKT
jgi:hypothetical protein